MNQHQSFWEWLIFLILGLAILSMIPTQVKPYLIGVVVLGSLVFINTKTQGGLPVLLGELTGTIKPANAGSDAVLIDSIVS
jgi:hypothetical protein